MAKETILIVDDIAQNLQILGEVLSAQGYRVAVATNGLQAIDVAQKVKPDLILLDVMMPEMDGYESCRRMKNIPEIENIPVIFLTARNTSEDLVAGFEAGAVDFVSKPFINVELLVRVKTQVRMKHLVEELERKNIELENKAIHDDLTGLFNHGHMFERLTHCQEIGVRYGTSLSVIMFDVDHFKSVNDNWGHQVGDQVLKKVSQIIKDTVRKTDIAGRYGGEEFMVICQETTIENTYALAERIRENIAQADTGYEGLRVTISGGVAESRVGEPVEQLVNRADELLYESKNSGRNKITQ
ncbi:diguanylate cyclase [Litoribacillus peritrichatus]|uniref:diguanylate cyclase n=1 Tax=Litoribacillus peritrichatus TaxID=718191 RepID=A0ABP7M7T7_9GAMM